MTAVAGQSKRRNGRAKSGSRTAGAASRRSRARVVRDEPSFGERVRSRVSRDVSRVLPDVINHITRQINERTLEDLRRFGMTVPRWSVLSQLALRDGRSIGALSRGTAIKQSSLTRVVDQMERDGLVERRVADADNRIVEVWLTRAGRETYDRAVPMALQRAHQALTGFRANEVEQLQGLLQRLLSNLRGRL
jgi:DNA-binding MarR family transcriptional regulator